MLQSFRTATACLCAAVVLSLPAIAGAQPDLKRWYFAEGSTNVTPGFAFEEEILLANPGGTRATVTLRFLPPSGTGVITGTAVIAPYSRQGINVRQFVPRGDAALEIVSDVDIVVERSMYWGRGLFNFGQAYNAGPITDLRGGHNVMGANAPSPRWMFAEGAAGGPFRFQTYVLVSNPSPTDTAQVLVNFLTSQGERIVEPVTLPPGSRETVWANAVFDRQLGARERVEFAIDVESSNGVGVVAERAMYWGPNLQGGHAAMGSQASSTWYFAEGIQGTPAGFDTYVLLYNPSTSESIDVTVDFFGPTGLARSVTQSVPPQSRRNVYAGAYPDELAGAEKAFAVRATNAAGKGFVAERAVYWRNLREGTASAGVTGPARKWGFADGQEGGFAQFQDPADPNPRPFSTYYLVLNTSDQPVNVRAVFYVEPTANEAAAGAETTITVAPQSRRTLSPSQFPALHNRKFAAFFEAAAPVIVERAMYWGAGLDGGHASAGAILPDTTPSFAAPTATAAPTLTGISPTRGTPAGGTVATVTGTGLGLRAWATGETTMAFGVTPVPPQNITVLNANTIRVVTPPSGQGLSSVLVNTRGVALELVGAFAFVDPFAAGPALGYGNLLGVVSDVAAARPGDLQNSCGNNTFMFEVVAELRRRFQSTRWGLNWKRGNVGDLSQDIVNYYEGPEGSQMRNSTQVRIYDIVGGHCGSRPSPFWVDQTAATRAGGTVGRWTSDPMCRIPRYRDAQFANGEWMFPECR